MVNRFDDPSEEHVESLSPERMEEVANRQIIRHLVLPHVRDDDLYLTRPVLMAPRLEKRACFLSQLGGNLDPDDSLERPPSGLMDNPSLPTSEVHKAILV